MKNKLDLNNLPEGTEVFINFKTEDAFSEFYETHNLEDGREGGLATEGDLIVLESMFKGWEGVHMTVGKIKRTL